MQDATPRKVNQQILQGLHQFVRESLNSEKLAWCIGSCEIGVHVDEDAIDFETVAGEPWAEDCFDDVSGARLDHKLVR